MSGTYRAIAGRRVARVPCCGTARPGSARDITDLRCLYVDLDGTLLGADGALLRDGDGRFSPFAARALELCERAGVEVVVVTGRPRAAVAEVVRLLAVRSYVFETGAGLVLDGELRWIAEAGTHARIAASGAPGLLCRHHPLAPDAPPQPAREVSHLLRGRADVRAANALLRAHGHADLRLLDNGHGVYHLVPAGMSKAAGVAAHRRARGYAAADCIAVGDSGEDVGMAEHVGAFWLVANAEPSAVDAARDVANVHRAAAGHGEAVHEAVSAALASRRA